MCVECGCASIEIDMRTAWSQKENQSLAGLVRGDGQKDWGAGTSGQFAEGGGSG